MIRSARKIVIKSKSFQNLNGMIFSPIIDLNGLILRADQPIPELIKQFLESHGAIVNRVMINNELFVKLYGEFNITVFEIKQFMEQNKELIDAQSKDLERVSIATKMQVLFAANRQQTNENEEPYYYTDGRTVVTIHPSRFIVGQKLDIVAGAKTVLRGSVITVGGDSNIYAKIISISGTKLPFEDNIDGADRQVKSGVLSTICTLKETTFLFNTKTSLRNSLVDSGETLTISGEQGHLNLGLDLSRDWVNNPYSYLPIFSTFKSGVRQLVREVISEKSSNASSSDKSSDITVSEDGDESVDKDTPHINKKLKLEI